MRRGVSPIIATILLIIMTVGIAALMYTWMSGLLTQLTTQSAQQIIQQTAIDFKLTPVSVSGVSSDANKLNFTVIITNTGNAKIDNSLNILIFADVYRKISPGTPLETCSCEEPTISSLNPGAAQQYNIICTCKENRSDRTTYYYVLKVTIGNVYREVAFT